MSVIVFSEEVEIPAWIVDHASFRRWAQTDAYPEKGKVSFLAGKIWVDVSIERLNHNLLKQAVAFALGNYNKARGVGIVIADRMMLTNATAGLSTELDGMFLTHESLREGRVILSEGGDSLEVDGSPDMVLEVISKHSVKKDTHELKRLYWEAGISEYWLIDSRQEEPSFTILRHGSVGYQPIRKKDGWLRSVVFGVSFRLRQEEGEGGLPVFHIDLK